MGFFKKFSNLFTSQPKSDNWNYWIYAQCNRCGEKIRARVDLRNDLSIEYGEKDSDTTYFCRKGLMGEQRCYQTIEVELTFDSNRKLKDKNITGGKFISVEEYEASPASTPR